MIDEKKRYIVHILGDDYTIISNEAESHIIASAKYIDDLMTDIVNKVPSANVQKISILAALRITSDLLHMQRQKQESALKIEACIEKIEHMLL